MARILVPGNFNRNSFFAITRARTLTAVSLLVYTYIYVGINLSRSGAASALRRRLHLERNVVREGAWVYKIYISVYVPSRAHAFYPRADTHRTRQPLPGESPCKTAAVPCASSHLSFPQKCRGTQITKPIKTTTCSALTSISLKETVLVSTSLTINLSHEPRKSREKHSNRYNQLSNRHQLKVQKQFENFTLWLINSNIQDIINTTWRIIKRHLSYT